MTNKEKAEEICMNIQPPYTDFIYQNYKTALEIAEWKDKQFNMIIEKIIDLFDKYPSNAVFSKNNVIEMFKTLKIAMEE